FEAVLTEAERVERHGFTAPELDRTRRDFLRSYEQAYEERAKTESSSYAEEYIQLFLEGSPSPGIGYEFALVKRLLPTITLDEVNKAAAGWFSVRDRVLLVNAPEKAGNRIPSAGELLALFDRVQRTDVAPYTETVSDAPLVAATLAPKPVVTES